MNDRAGRKRGRRKKEIKEKNGISGFFLSYLLSVSLSSHFLSLSFYLSLSFFSDPERVQGRGLEHGQHCAHTDQPAVRREVHSVRREPRPGRASATPISQPHKRGANVINESFGMEIGVTVG